MKIVFFANTAWYLYNFRLPMARLLRSQGHHIVMMSPPGPYAARLEQAGFAWQPVPVSRAGVNPLREASSVAVLAWRLRHEQPQVLHAFTLKCAIQASLASRLVPGMGVVQAVAGMGYVFASSSWRARCLRPWVRAAMRMAFRGPRKRLVLQNPDDVRAFVAHRIVHPSRIHLIEGSGVEPGRFTATPRRDGPLHVVMCARLLREKGVEAFADAGRILRQQGRDVRLLLAGPLDPDHPSAIREAQVRTWVDEGVLQWLGHVDDVPRLLRSAHVMALPSYYREGVPRSLIEGAMAGLALITTDQPGCRQVVTRHGVDGLWARPRDPAHLAECIARLDDDRSLLVRLATTGQAQALRRFGVEDVTRRTCGVYNEVAPVVRARR